MLNDFSSPAEKYLSLGGYVLFGVLFAVITIALIRVKIKSAFHWTLLIVSAASFLIDVMIFIQAFVRTELLNQSLSSLFVVLVPLLFFLAGIGFAIYGVAGVVKRETFIRLGVLQLTTKGPTSVYMGLIITVAGLMTALLALNMVTIFLCTENGLMCSGMDLANKTFAFFGNILIFISKPLVWTGIIR